MFCIIEAELDDGFIFCAINLYKKNIELQLLSY
jgi:hypothetical protein